MPHHTCLTGVAAGQNAAQATDQCERCQFLLHLTLAPTTVMIDEAR